MIASAAGARDNPLIGRDAELETLRLLGRRAAGGDGQVAILSGDAGLGKSALAEAFLQEAEAEGHTVLAGHAYLAEGETPYGVILDAIRDGLRRYGPSANAAAELPFSGRAVSASQVIAPDVDRARLFESGYEFFRGLIPKRGALVVFLDDLQWADTASLEFVHFLGRSLTADRMLLIASYRRGDAQRQPALPRALASLRRQGHLTELLLRPLTRAEAAGLAARAVPAATEDAELVDAAFGRSRGNPLFFIELLRASTTGGLALTAGPAGGAPGLPEEQLPPIIQDVVQSRLADLPEASRRALDLAAVLGVLVPYPLWAEAGDPAADDLPAAVEPLCQLDLLHEQSSGDGDLTFAFSHPLLRDAVYAALTPVRRQHLHTRIADALIRLHGTDDPDHLSDLSYHLARCGDRSRQAKAVAIFLRAGHHDLRAFANEEAAAHYRLALRHLPEADLPSESRLEALEGYGRALRRLGDFRGAVAAWEEAWEGRRVLGQARRAAETARRIGLAKWNQGLHEEALASYRGGLDILGADGSAPEAADLHQEVGAVWLALGDTERARSAAERAATLAEDLGVETAAARAETMLLLLHASAGDRPGAARHAARAIDYASRSGARSLAWRPHYVLGRLALEFGDARAAAGHLDAAFSAAEAVGSPVLTVWPLTGRVALKALTGEWIDALELADRGLAIARRSQQIGVLVALLLDAGLLRWLIGESAAGWEQVQEAEALLADSGTRDQNLHCLALSRRAYLHLLAGEAEPALTFAQQAAALTDRGRVPPLFHTQRSGLPTLIEAARLLGRPDLTAERLEQLAGLARRLDHAPGLAQVDRLRGTLATDQAAADAHFARSAELWQPLQQPYETARTLRDWGRSRREFGDRDGALNVLRDALEIFEKLGAPRDADLTRSELRALGARPGRRRPATGPHGLTERELQIARLIADHRSNREIAEALVISPLTVETHVHNILRKLDLTSRALIHVWAAEHGLLQ